MADADTPNPQPPADEMHWGLTYIQNDLKEVKQDLRDVRREMTQLRSEARQDLRSTIGAMMAVSGVVIGILIAYFEYRLPIG